MKTLSIDIETYSSTPLQKSGVYRYVEADDFEMLLFGYSVDYGPVQVVDLACGEHIPNLGAGDQGTVYGYAINETSDYIPLPLLLSHNICKRLETVRRDNLIQGLKPDGKAQVTIEYVDGKPSRVKTIVVSVQHEAKKDMETLKNEVTAEVLYPVFSKFMFDKDTEILVNPSGRFVEGGPKADTGLTGRKLMVDTYGGLGAHGGGAFSGKDPTKVDRSGAYMARYIAKHIVFSRLADECQVAISYAIGKAEPVAVQIDTFGTGKVSDDVLAKAVNDIFDMRPAAIINKFSLKTCSFADYSAYGHFGNGYPAWEHMEQYEELREAVKKYENDN